MSEIQEKLMEMLKDFVNEKDKAKMSIDTNLDDIPFLKNEWFWIMLSVSRLGDFLYQAHRNFETLFIA